MLNWICFKITNEKQAKHDACSTRLAVFKMNCHGRYRDVDIFCNWSDNFCDTLIRFKTHLA